MSDEIVKSSDSKDSTYRDVLYTIDSKGRRRWVYPEIIWGKFLKSRTFVAYVLMLIYLAAPWIRINGGPLILLNLAERKFTFFGVDFWATDTIFLMFFLTSMGLTLFLATAVLGRVWCGWACPETVFLEFLFRPIERLIEGNASQRKRLDERAWDLDKIIRKGLKHLLSASLASVIANTALAYFIGTDRLLEVVTQSPAENPTLFSVMIFMMGLMAFQFGWFREQFCTVLCPYARFQSVMLDPDSLVIGYDKNRGEPRGKKKSKDEAGDCVDCKLCVRVCPTGIDIRNGLQLECVNCAQCVDACDSIMAKIGRPLGLIRYDTERKLLGGQRKFLRPRLFVYIFILLGYGSAFWYFLSHRLPFDFDVVREARTALFTVGEDGKILNQFKIRLSNKSTNGMRYKLIFDESINGISYVAPMKEISIESGKMFDIPIFVNFDPTLLNERGIKEIEIKVLNNSGEELSKKVNLVGQKK